MSVVHRRTKRRPITYGSVCSGIEAASVAWEPLGWRPVFFAEVDAFPSAVLAERFPTVPNMGDFTKIGADDVAPIDVLVAGTPCQDFSVAGRRLGIHAPRGNLALEFLALASRLRPRWIVFENVPGLLSNWSGAPDGPTEAGAEWEGEENSDFAAFLGAVRDCGYLGCWRVLDAQYAGLAQRRERVFFVGYLGDWRPPAAVLLEPASLLGNSPPRREAGKGVAPTISERTKGGGGLGTDFDCDGGLITIKGAVIGRKPENGPQRGDYLSDNSCYTLNCTETHVIAFAENSRAELRLEGGDGSTVGALKQGGGKPGQSYAAVAFGWQEAQKFSASQERTNHLTRNQTQAAATSWSVRRLTPRECERLQGFPEVQKSFNIVLCQNLSDQQRQNALAALQCRSELSSVWAVDGSGWKLSAGAVESYSNTVRADRAPLVVLDVLIDLERMEVVLSSREKSFLLADNAGEKNWFRPRTEIESFAHLGALMTHVWEKIIILGKEGLPKNKEPFTHLWNGKNIALKYGHETNDDVKDVAQSIKKASQLITSTTSQFITNISDCVLVLKTLSCCVVRAIDGFIPEKTKNRNCCVIRITTTRGFTYINYRGKPAADGPRYRALGNSMAVPVMRGIGARIALVDEMIK